MRACASGWSQRYPVRGECPMLGRESRSISHNHDDGDDNDCGDQRKRTIECFRARPCGGHFERRHDIIYFRGLPRLAEINSSQSAVLRSRPAFLSASVRCAPGGISRASSRASIALALLTAIIGRDHAFQPFAHGSYWGGLSSPPSHSRTLDSIGSFDMVEV